MRQHEQILHWWNLTNKTYLESCWGGEIADKLCLPTWKQYKFLPKNSNQTDYVVCQEKKEV